VLDTVIAKALAKQPEHRYPTCAAFVAALRAALAPAESRPLAPPVTRVAPLPETAATQVEPQETVERPETSVPPRARRRRLVPLVLVLAALAAAAIAVIVVSGGEESPRSGGDRVSRVLDPVVSADSALADALGDLTDRDPAKLETVSSAALGATDAVTRAQGAASVLGLADTDADAATRLDQVLEANLTWARQVGAAATDLNRARARAAEVAEGNTRRGYEALAAALPGVEVPSPTAVSGSERLVVLTDVEVAATSDRAANRAYVESIDRLLTNSKETRMDLGELVNEVQGRSISFAAARRRIDRIITQRQSLQDAVAAFSTPKAFQGAAELLRASIGAALDDDFAIQAWINALYQNDPSAPDRLAEHAAASQRASTAKRKFVESYDRLRKRLLGLPPLEVGTSY